MQVSIDQMKQISDKAKSTWDKFRKERDFHKTHHEHNVAAHATHTAAALGCTGAAGTTTITVAGLRMAELRRLLCCGLEMLDSVRAATPAWSSALTSLGTLEQLLREAIANTHEAEGRTSADAAALSDHVSDQVSDRGHRRHAIVEDKPTEALASATTAVLRPSALRGEGEGASEGVLASGYDEEGE